MTSVAVIAIGRRCTSTRSPTISKRSFIARTPPARGPRPKSASTLWDKIAILSDPFGHGFCLIQFLGHGNDEIADAEARPHPLASSP